MMLDKLLPKLAARRSRVLIFSQFVRVLDVLSDYMTMRGCVGGAGRRRWRYAFPHDARPRGAVAYCVSEWRARRDMLFRMGTLWRDAYPSGHALA